MVDYFPKTATVTSAFPPALLQCDLPVHPPPGIWVGVKSYLMHSIERK